MTAWGPRAKPHDEWPPERPKGTPPKRIEEPIGTALGVLVVACLVVGAAIWWVRG